MFVRAASAKGLKEGPLEGMLGFFRSSVGATEVCRDYIRCIYIYMYIYIYGLYRGIRLRVPSRVPSFLPLQLCSSGQRAVPRQPVPSWGMRRVLLHGAAELLGNIYIYIHI